MDEIKEYLLSVTAAAILCGCVCAFCGKKDMISSLLRLLCGVFMTLTVLAPVVDLPIIDFNTYYIATDSACHSVAQDAVLMAQEEQCAIIKQRSEAYILDKAAILECDVEVAVTLNTEAPFQPIEVKIFGEISPYAKSQLSYYLESDLGIAGEDQTWIG